MKILVVEDDDACRRAEILVLEHHGHTVIWAADGAGALELLRTEAPDVVLLDLNLPKVSGYEVAGRMRLDPWLRAIPVIVLTGAHPEEIESKITNPLEGVVTILGKPLNIPILLSILKRLSER